MASAELTTAGVEAAERDPDQVSGRLRWIPGLALPRGYRRRWLPHDLLAALALTGLLVPQGMAYAQLAGLPAVTGLYRPGAHGAAKWTGFAGSFGGFVLTPGEHRLSLKVVTDEGRRAYVTDPIARVVRR